MSGALIFVLALVVVALVLVFAGVKTVSQGTNWTVERFGRYTRTLSPGLHLIVPFIDTIGRKMNMQENVLDIPRQKVITKDNATVQVDAVAFYQVIDAARAAYEVQNLHLAITNLALDQHPKRHGQHGARRGAVQAQRDQQHPAGGHRPGDRPVGRQGAAHRGQGHRAARGHRGRRWAGR